MPKNFALSLETLTNLDSKFTAEVDDLFQLLAADCKKRPHTTAARVLTIRIDLRPAVGDPEDVEVTPKVNPSIPAGGAHKSRTARVSRAGQLMLDFIDTAEADEA